MSPPAKAGDARDVSLIPGTGRSPDVGNGNPLQYSCQGNPMDRGAWRAIVHWVTESHMTQQLNNNCVQGTGGCEIGSNLILLSGKRNSYPLAVSYHTSSQYIVYMKDCAYKITHRKPSVVTDYYIKFTKIMNVKCSLKFCGIV